MRPRHPEVTVRLIGGDRHPVSLVTAVRVGLRRCGVPAAEIEAFSEEAKDLSREDLLRLIQRWVNVQ